MSLFVKKGDNVVVLSGEDNGKKGKILVVMPKANRVIVEGVNIVSRHTKPRSAQAAGGIVKKEAAINASNVQILCPSCDKPTRVGFSVGADGKKVRVCKHANCGKTLDSVRDVKTDKTVKKTAAKPAAEKKAPVKKEKPAVSAEKTTAPEAVAEKKAPVKKTVKKTEPAPDKETIV